MIKSVLDIPFCVILIAPMCFNNFNGFRLARKKRGNWGVLPREINITRGRKHLHENEDSPLAAKYLGQR